MIIPDVNILLYAYRTDSRYHTKASVWLKSLFEGAETVGLPWATIWAFIRIATTAALWPTPASLDDVLATISDWIHRPRVHIVNPGPKHLYLVSALMRSCNVRGPHATDAVLAALALEHDAILASADRDFARFPDLRWIDPVHA